MSDTNIISESVKEKRREKKFTQEQLANKAGIGLNTLKKVEAGNSEYSPTADTLLKIAKALRCPVSVLYGEKSSMPTLIVLLRFVLTELEARPF